MNRGTTSSGVTGHRGHTKAGREKLHMAGKKRKKIVADETSETFTAQV